MKTQYFSRPIKFVLVLLAGGVLATACKPHDGPHGGMMFDVIAHRLDLSDTQEEKLLAIKDEMKRLRKEAMAEKQSHKQIVIDMITADTLDQQQVLDLFQQHQDKLRAAAPSVVEKIANFHATLTSEQKEKIVKRIESHKRK